MTFQTYLITKLITSGTLNGITVTEKMNVPTTSPAPFKPGQVVKSFGYGPSYVILACCIAKA